MGNRRVVFLGRYESTSPHVVFEIMASQLSAVGIDILIDNQWSDDHALADLLIVAEPLPNDDVPPDSRILGQRTLNRRTRLDVAMRAGVSVAPFGGPRDDRELSELAASWNTECVVLKYDWSTRRSGVFLWPLEVLQRRKFPQDFNPHADVFMAFLGDDPQTYKVDAFGGVVLGAYVLPTRDMRTHAWEGVNDRTYEQFDLPETVSRQIATVSAVLLEHGAGYSSFDLMRTGDLFRIIEVNTSGVSVAMWDDRPGHYADAYTQAIIETLDHIDRIPRYRELSDQARRCGNDREAKGLPQRKTEGDQRTGGPPPMDRSAQAVFMITLEQTDHISSSEMGAIIAEPLTMLLRHSRNQVPFYANRLDALFLPDGSIDLRAWSKVPILRRSDFAENRRNLIARILPPGHGSVSHASTAGTEHEPATISASRLASAVNSCIHTRLFAWHGVPFADPMATIRDAEPQGVGEDRKWAESWATSERGPMFELSSLAPVATQLQWLKEQGPIWLRTRPSLAQQMALMVRENPGLKPELLGILTGGEVLTHDQRGLCQAFLGHSPKDLYELREAGVVAIQCPKSDAYHVQSEAVLVEIIDEMGNGCRRGATGRLVVTPLYNLAMPLIRYDTGDLAIAGDRFDTVLASGRLCSCGRRLPRLLSIPGRSRNRFSGALRLQPEIDSGHLHSLTGARLWQIVQESAETFLLRLDSNVPMAATRGGDAAKAYVAHVLGANSRVAVEYADLAREAGECRFEPYLRRSDAWQGRAI